MKSPVLNEAELAKKRAEHGDCTNCEVARLLATLDASRANDALGGRYRNRAEERADVAEAERDEARKERDDDARAITQIESMGATKALAGRIRAVERERDRLCITPGARAPFSRSASWDSMRSRG